MKITRVLLSTILLVCVASLIACGGGGSSAPSSPTVQPVTPPLAVSTTTLPSALEGAAYSQQIQAIGGHAPYTFTLNSGFLPNGLNLSTSGVVSGTSIFAGIKTNFFFNVTVTDSSHASVAATLQVPAVGKLQITTTTIRSSNANVPYTGGSIFTSGGAVPVSMTISAGALPPGLTLTSSGGISGIPTASGTFNFTVAATDSDSPAQTTTSDLSLTITHDFAFFPQQAAVGVQAKPYSFQLKVVNGTQPYNFALGQNGLLPPGLTLDSATGIISGTPTQSGSSSTAVQVTDSSTPPRTISNGVVLTIAPPLSLPSNTTLNDAVQNSSYFATLAAFGGIGPYTLQVSAGALPPGVTATPFGSSIQVSGVPTGLGTFSFTLEASDSENPPDTVTQTYTVRVNPQLVAQVPSPLPAGLEGRAYSTQFGVTGGIAPYRWSFSAPPVPLGLSIDPSTGVLSGTLTGAFDGSLFISVTDSSRPPQIVNAFPAFHVASLLHIATTSLPQVVSNSNVNLQLATKGGTGPFAWSITGGTLPTGLTLSPTGAITGTATGATSPFTVTVNDQGPPAQTATATLTLPIAAAAGRNDTIATATSLSNGTYFASISPIGDPPGVPASGDVDIYKITADPGAVVHIETTAARLPRPTPLDTVIEITDANGARLQTCNTSSFGPFFSSCMNDDIDTFIGNTDSILFFQAPSSATGPVTFYVKVLDFRGDARPDMVYSITVDGAK